MAGRRRRFCPVLCGVRPVPVPPCGEALTVDNTDHGPTAARAAEAIASSLLPFGLDLVHPFRVSWYDAQVESEYHLPTRRGPDSLAVLVGNTRALWAKFLPEADRVLPDPLDRWIEEVFRRALGAFDWVDDVIFAHEPPPRRLPMQRLVVASGFAPLSAGQLLAHVEYGPWFAVRAVVLVDAPGPVGDRPDVGAPCAGCEAPCLPAFERACEVTDVRTNHEKLRENWRPWLAVRDACPEGRAYRYTEDQIRFHYARTWPES